jgi:NCAIR mutase (PurE)-related protein
MGPKNPTDEGGTADATDGSDEVASVTTGQDSDVDAADMRQLLDAVRDGRLPVDDALAAVRRLPFADLGFARVDHHRALRQGRAETVYGPGKTPDQCATIVAELLAGPGRGDHDGLRGPNAETGLRGPNVETGLRGPNAQTGLRGPNAQDGPPVLLSRADDHQATAALAANPGGTAHRFAGPDPHLTVVWRPAARRPERVVVVTAGTADLPVADECAVTLAAHGIEPERLTDVGVAGLHRLLAVADRLVEADAVVVVAGMEGALASVVGGLTGAPVIAVPTSVGYGASLDGVTALLGMLASCASGLAVVGIDNGFGAACAVLRLLPASVPGPAPRATTVDVGA